MKLIEKITSEITDSGLWVSSRQIISNLSAMKSETQKKNALKAQLRFRKTVLQQQTPDESIYKFSSKEMGQYNSRLLHENLLKVITDAESSNESTVTSLTGKYIEHNFQDTEEAIKAYKGRVITQVPGFPDWYNVVYNEESDVVYTFRLKDDIENGDLKIL